MPIHNMQNQFGRYYQYGNSGKKYYYTVTDPKSEKLAYKKVVKQMKAIEISRHKKKIKS